LRLGVIGLGHLCSCCLGDSLLLYSSYQLSNHLEQCGSICNGLGLHANDGRMQNKLEDQGVVTVEVTKTLGLEGWKGSKRLLDHLDQWQLHLGS